MKKLVTAAVVLAVALIATSTFAGFNIPGAPSSVDSAVKQGIDMGVKEEARKKIRQCPCEFTSATATNSAKCCGKPLESFVRELGSLKGINDAAGNRMYIRADVQGPTSDVYRARDSYVERELERINKWYRTSVYSRKGTSRRISISIQ